MTSRRFLLLLAGLLLLTSAHAFAITRTQVMTQARGYAFHPWRCAAANLSGGCPAGYSSYFTIGDHLGLPYDWGGYMTLHEFDTQIAAGRAAGSPPMSDVLACNVGLDCSGFVAQCWDVAQVGTWGIPDLSTEIGRNDLLPGDVYNQVGYHVVLWSHRQADGRPYLFEAMGYSVHPTFNMGWSYLEGFTPRRLNGIVDGPPDAAGTAGQPIAIEGFPFTHTGDTSTSPSDILDYCRVAPATRETGPEVFYRIELPTPGRLVASIQDAQRVDIDIHLYGAVAEADCLARHDSLIDLEVDCGAYYLVADTYASAAEEFPGQYDLVVEFTPAARPCGERPGYDFAGQPGGACAFPGDYDLPFCNESLGATTCLYTGEEPGDESFCSMECERDLDCQAALPGGCCADIGADELYCLVPEFCAGEGEGEGAEPEGAGGEGEGEGLEGEGEGLEGEGAGEGVEGEGEGVEGEGLEGEGEGEGVEGEGLEGEGEGEGDGLEGEGEPEGAGEGAEGEGSPGCQAGVRSYCDCGTGTSGVRFCDAAGRWGACDCSTGEGEGEREGDLEGDVGPAPDPDDRGDTSGCGLVGRGATQSPGWPALLALLLGGAAVRWRR